MGFGNPEREEGQSPPHASPPYHILDDSFLKSKFIVAESNLFEGFFLSCEFEYCFSPQEENLLISLNFKLGLNCTFLLCPDCRYLVSLINVVPLISER